MLAELFGPRCAGCRRAGTLLCPSCSDAMPPPGAITRPAHVARVVCAWPYEGPARRLVLDLKLGGLAAAAAPASAAMTAAWRAAGAPGEVLVPVPGRRGDPARRGFDHAALLARGVGRLTGLPVRHDLRRVGRQKDQAGLGRAERAANLRGAFAAAGSPSRAIVLVDDLVTTGATASAAARALRAAGAGEVTLLVACCA